MESNILPLIAGDSCEKFDKDVIYMSEIPTESGDFNSKIYKCVFETKDLFLKRIPGSFMEKKKILEDFSNLRKLACHDNILQYFHCMVCEYQIMIFSESWENSGKALSQLVKENNLQLNPFQVIRQCATGLEYLHGNNIPHGNLKPSNILVYSEKQLVKLSNYGMRSVYGDLVKCFLENDMCIGIVDWMGPELLLEYKKENYDPLYDQKCDIFWLGCIFYFIVSNGHHPYGNIWIRAQNILDNIISLDENDVPKFRHALPAISLMNSTDLEHRPSAKCLSQNALLCDWDNDTTVNLLKILTDVEKLDMTENMILAHFENQMENTDISLWTKHIDPDLLEWLKENTVSTENTVCDLFKAVLFVHENYNRLPPNLSEEFGGAAEFVVNFINNKFPYTVNILWTLLQKRRSSKYLASFFKDSSTYPLSDFILGKYPGLKNMNVNLYTTPPLCKRKASADLVYPGSSTKHKIYSDLGPSSASYFVKDSPSPNLTDTTADQSLPPDINKSLEAYDVSVEDEVDELKNWEQKMNELIGISDEDDDISTTYDSSPESTASTATDDLDLVEPYDGDDIPKKVWEHALNEYKMKQSPVEPGRVLFEAIFEDEEVLNCSISGKTDKRKFNKSKIRFLKQAIAWIMSSPARPWEFKVDHFDHSINLSDADYYRVRKSVLVKYACLKRKYILLKELKP